MGGGVAGGGGGWGGSGAKGLLGRAAMRASLQQGIERVMNVTVGREMERVERFMNFLATVGATAPFVGLFGTVWGIMDSFQSIAAAKNTSLAVVAPGIAESLLATALGLVAAIPARGPLNKLSPPFCPYSRPPHALPPVIRPPPFPPPS